MPIANLSPELIETMARTCYEANRALDASALAVPSWHILCPNIKDHYYHCVLSILEQPEIPAEELHAHWLARRIVEGWSLGSEFNLQAKTDPWLEPFANLTPFRQLQYRNFKSLIDNFRRTLPELQQQTH